MRSSWKTLFGIAASSALSSACAPSTTELPARPRPEDVWLSRVGTGPEQTRKVCASGARDRVVTTLCDPSTRPIGSLEDLYRAVRLGENDHRLVAANVHSLGLSVRSVSSLNPRAFVFEDTKDRSTPLTPDRAIAVGFSRGEQFVEFVGLDPSTYDYNFYLLRFEQDCNHSRCTPEDLLSAKIESGWTNWTLYSDRDLVDTPLDCLSCHQPYGAGTRKLVLMRQLIDPWMHWGDFRGGDERTICAANPADGSGGKVVVTADGLDVLQALEGSSGRYAGVPVSRLHAAKSGEIFTEFINDADGIIHTSPIRQDPSEQPFLQTREVVCERFHTGASKTWDEERQAFLARGFPMPYYAPDVTDPQRRAEVLADRLGFLRRHEGDDALELTYSLMGQGVATDIGLLPREGDSAPDILRSMCIRCHAGDTDPKLRRARFNVAALDRIPPENFREIRRRLSLPASSPELMPPRRAGELPAWAIARVTEYLRERCVPQSACR